MRYFHRNAFAMSLMVLTAACDPAGPPATPVAGQASPDLLIDNVNGYTLRAGELHRFGALRFSRSGEVVATYPAGSAPGAGPVQRIDGEGLTLLPGLIDAHGHIVALGLARNRVDLVGTRSLAEALERVRAYAESHPDVPWILGRGWNQVLWKEKRFPRASDLDALGLDRPVWLGRIDGHAGWGNSIAITRAGVGNDTPDPRGGKILRDNSGAATGVFVDAASGLVEKTIPAPSQAELRAALLTAMDELASLGVTSAHDAGIDPELASLYRELDAAGRLPVRVYAMLSQDRYREFGQPLTDEGSGFLAIRSIKAYLDGALGSRGAALLAPYTDEPGNTGLLFSDVDEFTALARDAAGRGFQVNVHAIGDAANRVALDAFAALDDGTALRHRIEHAQVISPADIDRFAALDVIASMQPIHATSDKNMAGDRLGPERLGGAYAWRQLLDSGARIASGSDFPVEPANPFFGLHAAVTRQDRDGQPPGGWRASEALTRAEALRTFTADAAYAAHQEHHLGSLEPGKRADFILIDRDIFEIPADDIWRTVVLETWVDGKRVYTHH